MTPKQKKAVPREAWLLLANAQLRSSRELLWLMGRSLDIVQAHYEGRDGLRTDPTGLEDVDLFHVAGARGVAEGRILHEPNGPDRTKPEGMFEAELRCLLNTLQGLSDSMTSKAETYLRLASATRRGRPSKRSLNEYVGLENFKWGLLKPVAGKAGRPRAAPISDPDLIHELAATKAGGAFRSERAILEGIARRLLKEQGKHTAGDRVPQLTSNLQKRVAAIRAGGIPKLTREIAEIRSRESE